MKIYLKEIKERYPKLEILNYNPEIFFEDFNHDSRETVPNSLFIPIVGDRFDGHEYIKDAFENGSKISLYQKGREIPKELENMPLILAKDIFKVLGEILLLMRERINVPVIAVTGSTGKTTTREMISTILSYEGDVLRTDRNINTLWGNAQILAKYCDQKYIVLEFGMDRKGEIKSQCEAFKPDIGIVLNVGYVHAMQLGGIENVYLEKRVLADYLLSERKPVLINIDDEWVSKIKSNDELIISFGREESSNYHITKVSIDKRGTHFSFENKGKTYSVNLNIFGSGYIYNAVAAIGVCNKLGIDIEKAIDSLQSYTAFEGRFEIIEVEKDLTVVNDAYNANPQSMMMSLETFQSIWGKANVKKILVLGDMRELGEMSDIKHRELGEYVKKIDVDAVYYVGEYYEQFGAGEHCKDIEELYERLKDQISFPGKKVILFKGSNSIGLEKVIQRFNPPI